MKRARESSNPKVFILINGDLEVVGVFSTFKKCVQGWAEDMALHVNWRSRALRTIAADHEWSEETKVALERALLGLPYDEDAFERKDVRRVIDYDIEIHELK
jgi:hypothetical protein